MIVINKIYSILALISLVVFSVGMLTNLGNIAFWEDEGETIQLGKSILKFGYPSVFDGRSFILIDTNFHPKNFLRYTSPYLQFYFSAVAIFLFKNPANTFLMRLPFALFAIAGIWTSWFIFKKFKYSQFSLFLYSLFLSTSVQLYLYWRQARHYALQFPLSLGLLWAYLNLDKRCGKILFLIFGFLFYHAYYPGFVGFYFGLILHALIRKYFDRSYRLKPLIINTLIIIAIHLPTALYLRHYAQLPNNNYIKTLASYLMDLNYFAYFKVAIISIVGILVSERPSFIKFFRAHNYSLSLLSMITASYLLLASFGIHHQRYVSVLIPYLFLLVAVLWDKLTQVISQLIKTNLNLVRLISIPFLVWLVAYSHPKFFSEIKAFTQELRSEYYGPIEGIVNTISGTDGLSEIAPNLKSRPDLLLATNFEDGAIYSYLDAQFLNVLAPTDEYKFGNRLPDWVIIRKHWGQEEYLNSFLQKGNYKKIETEYCDLQYENIYTVRTHHFQTVTPCPNSKLTLYRLISRTPIMLQ